MISPDISGVPHISALGPLIYFNDLPDNLSGISSFYADNLIILSTDASYLKKDVNSYPIT